MLEQQKKATAIYYLKHYFWAYLGHLWMNAQPSETLRLTVHSRCHLSLTLVLLCEAKWSQWSPCQLQFPVLDEGWMFLLAACSCLTGFFRLHSYHVQQGILIGDTHAIMLHTLSFHLFHYKTMAADIAVLFLRAYYYLSQHVPWNSRNLSIGIGFQMSLFCWMWNVPDFNAVL